MAGKGSKQRPTNQEKYAASWETIFGKKGLSNTPPASTAEVVMPMQSTLMVGNIAFPATPQTEYMVSEK